MSTILKWLGEGAQGVEDTFKWTVGQGKEVVEHTEDITAVVTFIPIILIAAGAYVFLSKAEPKDVAAIASRAI